MRERQRNEIVRGLLAERGFLSIADLMAATGVSAASARRDAGRLAEAGHAMRIHGGIHAVEVAGSEPSSQETLATRSFVDSQTTNVEAKRAIARQAVELCEDGDAVIINGGTTTFQMAQFLRDRRLKVLTNSYPLAELLIHETENRVALPGGEVYRVQKLIVAPFDDDAIQHYWARLMIVLADASKFAPRGSLVVCPLSGVDTLITDEAAPPEALAMLREAGVKTIVVDRDASATEAA